MTIKTNGHYREVIGGYELTEKERKEFDYITDFDVGSFVRYKGELYDLNDIERSNIEGWDGMVTDTFFSGILFKFGEGFETVKVGRFYT